MSVRSLNKVMLIGNLTRDPNLRYTANNTAVCSFGIATNRTIISSDGNKDERVDFHNIVAWGKLAEICGQLLTIGVKVYVEGRIQTRDWKTQEGEERRITEVVIDQMILLNSPGGKGAYNNQNQNDEYGYDDDSYGGGSQKSSSGAHSKSNTTQSDSALSDDVAEVEDIADDIPF